MSVASLVTAVESRDPETGLAAVAAVRRLVEELEVLHVDNARSRGWSWQAIADALGVTRQTCTRSTMFAAGCGGGAEMFEHLEPQARMIVDDGIAEARRSGHGWFGSEHLLLGGLANRSVLPVDAQALLPDVEHLRQYLFRGMGRAATGRSDDALLASLGIDLEEVRRRAAETFGAEAVQRAAVRARSAGSRPQRPRRRTRRRERIPRCLTSVPGESLMMAPRVKEAFERARKRYVQLGQPSISAPVLLAALLGVKGVLAAELLEDRGVDVGRVRAALDPA
jgi:hypothetical protein